ncbi:hypothetical protein HHI36_021061 [Cryptolaemus montrouzieri]|uniref:Eukaryotic translation initiation factor 4E transporter n=1 Tax=Cryptolaemus montrouzieri TaxID=559131 RepID=A0ABD2MWM4_9CUCU
MSQKEDAEDFELQVEKDNSTCTGDPAQNEDEQLIDGIVFSNTPELTDPAILAVREIPKFQYSKEELINLREVPLSKKKPDFINIDVLPPSIWDERKKSASPSDPAPRGDQLPDNRRRPGDPRERLRKENDGIVLSPQRRSFNSGCFVPMREQPQVRTGGPRPHSPMGGGGGGGKGDNQHINVREIQTGGNRRIGSGRILRDAWDFNEKTDGGENDYYRSGQEDRRSFRRDFDPKDKDRRNSGGRYGRRISGSEKDEEPEWFSGGPVSQNDTIELRGFDEPEKAGNNGCNANNANNKKKLMSSQAKRVREWAKKKTDTLEEKPNEELAETAGQKDAKGGTGTPTTQDGGGAGKGIAQARSDADQQQNDNDKENRQVPTNNGGMEIINEHSFLFDDIFKCDTIPGLLTNGVEGTADNNTKSRFSRWFKQESPDKASESRRSSLQEEHLLKNLLNDINEPATVAIPPQLGNSESYFAPISPAAVNAAGGEPGAPRPGQVNIAEMFQRGKREQNPAAKGGAQADVLNNIKSQFPGKVMSLNELESRMRKGADISGGGHAQSKAQIKKEDDMSAFKRLLAQVSGGHVVTANNGAPHQKLPPMSLMEMLSHSQQQEEVQARLSHQSHLVGGPGSPKPAIGALHNDFLLKMQQAQQEQQAQLQRQQQINMLNKLMGLHTAAPHLRASPLQDLAQQQSKELLSRPEAQAILQGLKRGDITPQHLYQQLANPALQPRHREMLYAILKMQRVGPSPRVLSPVPPPTTCSPNSSSSS